jgi:diguanylate cyclase (GGDEF)-like protein
MTTVADDELITIIEDSDEDETLPPMPKPWRVLVVDDDAEVHAATRIALGNFRFKGRSLGIESCFSARQAYQLLTQATDIACILLDVVMEDEQAGLTLVRRIREEIGNHQVRIVLRTGQPGYAPEIDVIQSYDINDYKAKTELTATRLASTVVTALRSYEQITMIDDHRRGLEMVIRASADLFCERNVRDFAAGVLIQLAAQLGVPPEGVLCTGVEDGDLVVVAGAGRFSDYVCQPLGAIGRPDIETAMRLALAERTHVRRPDCTVLYLESATSQPAVVYVQGTGPAVDGQKDLLELFCMNIALGFETAQLFERLKAAAYLDSLTGLCNRAGFVMTVAAQPQPIFVSVLDIDQFHEITRHLGFQVGDHLLKAVAQRLRTAFPDALAMARLSSDQFALALPEAPAPSLTRRVSETFDSPLSFAGLTATIGMTGGLATAAAAGTRDAEALLRGATRAMKEAKRRARGVVLAYDAQLECQDDQPLVLMTDLRLAIRADEIILYFQPKLSLANGAACGVEALVRWASPKHGLLLPGTFIPVAEVTGLIVPLGQRIFELALRQHKAWQDQGLDIPIAVNVSAVQIQQADFLTMVDDVIQRVGGGTAGIEVEITETSLLADDERIFAHLNGLRRRGFALALDDFGTGYSSLSHLSLLPLTTLKIDRMFVSDITESDRSRLLVEAMVGVARAMGMTVVAEGIETIDQANKLKELNVDVAQGFLYGRPMPAPQLVEWWTANRRG